MRRFLIFIPLYRLRHETLVQLVSDTIGIVDVIGAGAVGVKTISDLLRVKRDDAEKHLDTVKKSIFTGKIVEQDKVRDGTLRGFAMAVKSYLHHANAEKRDAATHLQIIIDNYGSMERRTYDDESAAIHDILTELATAGIAPLVALLGLGEWVAQLTADNNRFFELMHERYKEEANRPSSMKESRAALAETQQALVDRVEALATLNGLDSSPELAEFVAEYNAMAARYKRILAIEKGRRAASHEGNEGDDDEENEENEGNDEGNDDEEEDFSK
ncbi:MAG: DUF6261 family protein [Odoribacteraceae bacterium]|jgi:hypothetical protein|nr:DUF6261 family protein [Odoribacteraceae bacterium]